MAKSGMGRRGPMVAVDIGTQSIKMALIERAGNVLKLACADIAPAPEGAIADGAVTMRAEVGAVVRNMLHQSGIHAKEAITAVGGPRVVVRPERMPYMPAARLRKSVKYEGQRYIPFPAEDSVVEFQVLRDVQEPGSTTKETEVVLAAAHRDLVDSRIGTLEAAGLEPLVVDVEAFAAMRALVYASLDPKVVDSTIVILRIGASFSEITLVKNGNFVLTRIIPLGGENFTGAIADGLQVPRQEARRLQQEVAVATARGRYEGLSDEETKVARTIAGPLEDLGKEVRRSLTYFDTQFPPEPGVTPERRVILCGGGCKMKRMAEYLGQQAQAQVEYANVFDNIAVDTSGFGKDQLAYWSPDMVVAVGLALTPYIVDRIYPFAFDPSRCGVFGRRPGAEGAPS